MVSLVTGGCGFIGSYLVKFLLEKGHKVVVIDNLSTGKIENIPMAHPNIIFFKEDITKYTKIREIMNDYEFVFIFHLAAIASVQKSIENPLYTHRVNTDATLYLLELARKQKRLKKFIFASSAAVYGDDLLLPKKETSPVKPISPYGIDKYCSEQFVIQFFKIYKLPTVSLRFFNVYGYGQDHSSPYAGVISLFVRKFFEEEIPEITIYGTGEQTRDFVYVKDVIDATVFLAEKENVMGEVFNIGSGQETSILELVSILGELFRKKYKVKFLPPREGDIKRSVASIEKLLKQGFYPKYTLFSGLKDMIIRSKELKSFP